MRIARYSADGKVGFAVVSDPGITEGDLVPGPETLLEILAGHPYGELTNTGRTLKYDDVRLLAPILPSKVVAIGKNYADHAAEMATEVPTEPLMFLKPSTSVVGPIDAIALPPQSQRVEHEAELAVVIGRLCKEVPAARAKDVILGYTVANDVTARDLQASDGQWSRAKGFDTFCPLGPWIETDIDLIADAASVTCHVNGKLRQAGSTADLVFDVPTLIEYVTSVMTLLPGDVILTGTPAGVGPLVDGDVVTCAVSGIGALTNRVVSRD